MDNTLYLKTMFCCMACDGNIAAEEIALVNQLSQEQELFKGIDIQTIIQGYTEEIQAKGVSFLSSFFKDVTQAKLSEEEELRLVKLAIMTIEADNNIEYSEVSFFKKLRKKLKISDDSILNELPDKEDYLLPDLNESDEMDWNIDYANICY